MIPDDGTATPSASDEVSDQAVEWLVRLQSGRATAADRADYRAWRSRNPAHEAAAREAEAIWHELPRTRHATEHAAGHASLHGAAAVEDAKRGVTRRAVLVGAVAASAALAIGSAPLGPVSRLFADLSTGVGERRQVRLPDDSVAFLNTATALSVRYSETERRVVLHAGEARFEIQSDPRHPFVVAAGSGEAHAIGTVFDVRRDGADVSVTVVDGTVEVRVVDNPAGQAGSVRVSAGQQASYGQDGQLTAPQPIDVAAATAWFRGKLIFNRRPLGEVVAELERYRPGRVVVADSRLRQLEVTGVFDLDDTDGLLRAVEQSLHVQVIRLPLLTVIR
jgi:transmembrane sensor